MESPKQAVAGEQLNLRIIGHAIDAMPTTRSLLTVVIIAALASLFDNMDSKVEQGPSPGHGQGVRLYPAAKGWVNLFDHVGDDGRVVYLGDDRRQVGPSHRL